MSDTIDDAIRANATPDGITADGQHIVRQKFQNQYRGGRHNQPLHFGHVITNYGDTTFSRSSSQTSTASSISEVKLPESASDEDILDFLELHYHNSKIERIFSEVTKLKQRKNRERDGSNNDLEAERMVLEQRDELPAYSQEAVPARKSEPLATAKEHLLRAHDLSISAFLGDTIYSFGELLMHPILDSLDGTQHE
ncbi:hypothetical protein H1R20_g989, partial [Candolleomyces eurysporus]